MDIRPVFAVLAVVAGSLIPAAVSAEDFRVETDVFVQGDDAPVSETLTIFTGNVVYDFILNGTEEITVFDVRRGRITLLDTERRVKTTLTTDQLMNFSRAIMTITREDEEGAWLAPEFAVNFEEDSSTLELTSKNQQNKVAGWKAGQVDSHKIINHPVNQRKF